MQPSLSDSNKGNKDEQAKDTLQAQSFKLLSVAVELLLHSGNIQQSMREEQRCSQFDIAGRKDDWNWSYAQATKES